MVGTITWYLCYLWNVARVPGLAFVITFISLSGAAWTGLKARTLTDGERRSEGYLTVSLATLGLFFVAGGRGSELVAVLIGLVTVALIAAGLHQGLNHSGEPDSGSRSLLRQPILYRGTAVLALMLATTNAVFADVEGQGRHEQMHNVCDSDARDDRVDDCKRAADRVLDQRLETNP